jgi:hypothetical protein
MRELLILVLSFVDFWFLPMLGLFLFSVFMEQIIRTEGAMKFRRFMWNQNLLLNFMWIISFVALSIITREPKDPFSDSGLIWRG